MSPVAHVLVLLVRGYRRAVSPLLPPRCRFAPSCSSYALEALQVHGAARGSWLALRRVARCHPFHPGGHDPVPPARRRPDPDGATPQPVRDDDGPGSVLGGEPRAAHPYAQPHPAPRLGALQ